MKSEILHHKLERYVNGKSLPAETKQIQTWLSCTTSEKQLTPEERSLLELEIKTFVSRRIDPVMIGRGMNSMLN